MFYRIPAKYMYPIDKIDVDLLYRNKEKCEKKPECKKDNYNEKDPIGIYALIDEEYVCSLS